VPILRGDALDLIQQEAGTFGLIATDPPYAFGGSGPEHAISATVAVVLREAAQRLERGRWMLVMCAASWRSQAYMVEAVRGILDPVRTATWCKPKARSKVATGGWAWTTVSVIAFRKKKAINCGAADGLDWILAEPVWNGRRAELPPTVADWMVAPFAVEGGRFLDPFAGSGRIVEAAAARGMVASGYEKGIAPQAPPAVNPLDTPEEAGAGPRAPDRGES
jgi:hypothetical protein